MTETIERINEHPVSSIAEAYRIATGLAAEEQLVIKGRRDGQPYVTPLTRS